MTPKEAYKLLQQHRAQLNENINRTTSHFQIRTAYVTAHEELMEIANNIIRNIQTPMEDDHK